MANALPIGAGVGQQQLGRGQGAQRQARRSSLDLDGSRIAANAGALALNMVVVLLLLSPVATPPLPPAAQRDPEIIWVRPRVDPKPTLVPVAPRPRVPKPLTAPQPRRAMPQVDRPPIKRLLPDNQPDDLAVPADQVADGVFDAGPRDTIEPGPALAASTQLQPISAPPPAYPVEALRSGVTGTVELEILVGVDGKPLQATVVRSSGHRALDQAARRVVLAHWRFAPAIRAGQPMQALGRVPIVFTLER